MELRGQMESEHLLYFSEEILSDFIRIVFHQKKEVFNSQKIPDQYISAISFSSWTQEAKSRKKNLFN